MKNIIKALTTVTISSVLPLTASVTLASCGKTKEFSIRSNITNGTITGPSVIKKDTTAKFTITPHNGYKYPNTVSIDGAKLKSYDKNNGQLIISNASKNVNISAQCLQINTYEISSSIVNGKISDESPKSIKEGETAILKIETNSAIGYSLPKDVEVVGAKKVSYESTTGELTISNPISNVTINATCEANTFTITENIENAKLSPDSKAEIKYGEEVTVTLQTESDSYKLPNNVTVQNATNKSYEPTTGELTISNPQGNVTISGNCIQVFSITANIENGQLEGSTSIAADESVNLKIVTDEGHILPKEISVEGANYTYDNQTGDLTIFKATDNVSITGSCSLKSYTITTHVTEGNIQAPQRIDFGQEVEMTITPNDRHSLPTKEGINVTNADIKSYDSESGKLIINNARDNVSISTECPLIPSWDITYNFPADRVKSDASRPTWIKKGDESTLTIKFEPIDKRYNWVNGHTDSYIKVFNAESSYTVGTNGEITLTISKPKDTVSIEVCYTQVAYSVTCEAEGILIEEYFPINQASGTKTINVRRTQAAKDKGLYLPKTIDPNNCNIKNAEYVQDSYTVVNEGDQKRCSATIQIRNIQDDVIIDGLSEFVHLQTDILFTTGTMANCTYECQNAPTSSYYWIFSDETETELTFKIIPDSGYSITTNSIVISDDKGVRRESEILTWDSESKSDTFTLSKWPEGIFYVRLFCFNW